ncbi:MAG: type I methionyl aminopeptidase [Oscillospiraceae bacterium]
MIVLRNSKELEGLALAGRISAHALKAAKDMIRPGVTTDELDARMREYILSQKAEPDFLGEDGYPKTACISINEEIIHGIPGPRVIKDGDIVSIDVGARIDGWDGDNAYTFMVGNVDPESRKLCEVTRECLMRGISKAKKGNRLGDIGHAVQSYAEENGFSVIRDYVGHGVGHTLHEDPEVPNYGAEGRGLRLAPGMVIAIEPMIAAGDYEIDTLDNGWTVVTADGSRAAHYEMTVAVTEDEPLILSDWRELL